MRPATAAPTLTGALVEFINRTRFADLPASTTAQAARCALDSIGCAIAGARTELGALVAGMVRGAGGTPESALLGTSGVRVPAPAAALANGTAANALDFDDTLLGHPGASVVQAALAIADAERASGADLLAAIVVGYELCGRLIGWLRPSGGRFTRIWDTATLQTFGAAAAVASLLRLTAAQTHAALGIAAATAPLPRVRKVASFTTHRPMLKSAWGWSAEAGVRAARLAAAGLTAQDDALDGDLGLWERAAESAFGLGHPADRLGETYVIERGEFKPYPCCRFIHPVLDALRIAFEHRAVVAAEIAEIRVATFALLGDAYHTAVPPATVSDAQFSTPFCVAAFVIDDGLRADRFTRDGIGDAGVVALAQRVRIERDDAFEHAYPARFGAAVRVRTRSGEELAGRVDHPRGGPEDPLPSAELIEKFQTLAMLRGGAAAGQRILALEREPDVRVWMDEFHGQV